MNKIIKKIIVFCFICCLAISSFGCAGPRDTKLEKIKIVATNFPPYDFSRQIAGDMAQVTMLLSPGEESHTFEPTPQDILDIRQADIFIAGGGESDAWVRKLISSLEIEEEKVLFMMECEGIKNIKTEQDHSHFKEDHSDFYRYDEHIWTSPENAKIICREIFDRISKADSVNEEKYRENLNKYLAELDNLDKGFAEIVSFANKDALVFGDRFAFRHFADYYGLSYFAAFPGCSGETEPDAKTIKNLIDKVKEEKIGCILYKEMSDGRVADAICEATGAKKEMLHSCGIVTKDEFMSGETYLSLMRKNMESLREALK